MTVARYFPLGADRPTAVRVGRSFLTSALAALSTFGWPLCRYCILPVIAFLLACPTSTGQEKRKVIIDQDEAGPAGTDLQSTLLLIQSPQTDVLGITVVTGDMWLKEEVAHTLRMLELIGRTDIPVVPGAEYPLVRTKEETELWEQQYGRVGYLGAWTPRIYHPADQVGELKEGNPKAKPVQEDAAHFLVRTVRQFPNQVTMLCRRPDDQLGPGNFHRS